MSGVRSFVLLEVLSLTDLYMYSPLYFQKVRYGTTHQQFRYFVLNIPTDQFADKSQVAFYLCIYRATHCSIKNRCLYRENVLVGLGLGCVVA
jgi:hypothetical protein